MNILLTGSTGFLGSHIADLLCGSGHRIRSNYRTTRPSWLDAHEIDWVQTDLRETGSLASLVSDIDVVIHNAGITRGNSLEEFLSVNTRPSLALAREAAQAGAKRFVFVSSMAAREPDELRDRGIVGPISDYGRSKREAESGLRIVANEYPSMRIAALRLSGVYGPRDRDLLPMFRMARTGLMLLPPKARRFQPLYAEDAARAVLAATESEAFGPFEIAEQRRYSWPEVSDLMGNACGRRLKSMHIPVWLFLTAGGISSGIGAAVGRRMPLDLRRAQDLSRYSWSCDPEPAAQSMGFRATVDLETGLRRTADWYRAHEWL